MPNYRPGIRVLAIRNTDPDTGTAYLFGEGVYEGDFSPEEAAGGLAEICREAEMNNPRIRLDSGEVVYGCECWWGPVEAGYKSLEMDYPNIVTVTVADYRAEWEAEQEDGDA